MVTGEMTLKQIARTIVPHPTRTELFDELARWRPNRLRRTAKKQISDRFNDKGHQCGPSRFHHALRCLLSASGAEVQTTFGERLLFGEPVWKRAETLAMASCWHFDTLMNFRTGTDR